MGDEGSPISFTSVLHDRLYLVIQYLAANPAPAWWNMMVLGNTKALSIDREWFGESGSTILDPYRDFESIS
jgi:hypothetical protein